MVQPIKSIVFAFVLASGFCGLAHGQQAHNSDITIGHRGVGALKADLKFLLDLTTPQQAKQFENVKDFIDLLVFGVDEERPLRIDILTGTTPPTYIIWGPYGLLAELKDDNISAQFQLKKDSKDLYKLLGQDSGWFRILPKLKYAILIIADKKDLTLLKQIILKLTNPMPEVAPLLLNGANMGVSLINKAITDEDQKKRRDAFGEAKSNKLAALQKRPTESETEFELRKGFVANQLTELERLVVESLNATTRFFLDKKNATAQIEFTAEAIPETSLAQSLSLFGQKPDAFASVEKSEDSVLSLRANHPIDDLRQKNGLNTIELMRADTAARLKADKKMTPEEKTASQQLFDGIAEVTSDGIKSGNVNGFLESTVDDKGEFVSVAAVSVVKGKRLDETLALIAKTGNGNKISIGTAEVGNVKIHELQLAKGFFQLFDDLFGPEKIVYIGTSDDVVWIGTGKASLEMMKKAIEGLKEPESNDVVLTIEGHVLPWAKRTLKLVKSRKLTDRAEEQKRRDRERSLQLAVDSLGDKDTARFEMTVPEKEGEENKGIKISKGVIFVDTGILKYLGGEISFYSKNNLQ